DLWPGGRVRRIAVCARPEGQCRPGARRRGGRPAPAHARALRPAGLDPDAGRGNFSRRGESERLGGGWRHAVRSGPPARGLKSRPEAVDVRYAAMAGLAGFRGRMPDVARIVPAFVRTERGRRPLARRAGVAGGRGTPAVRMAGVPRAVVLPAGGLEPRLRIPARALPVPGRWRRLTG